MVDLAKIRKKGKKIVAELQSGRVAEEPVAAPRTMAEATQHATPSTQHETPNTQHETPNAQHSPLSAQHSALSTQHPELSTEHSAPSSQHSELSTQHPAPPESSTKLDRFKEHAGEKREGFVHEVEQVSTGAQLELLTFTLAREQYAVDIEHIVEIVTPRAVTRIPNADESVVGIISLRGTIVTVVDVRRRLRHPPANGDDADRRIIVVEKGGETLGFEVDRVLRVVKADPGEIEPHPVVHASELHEAIRGVFRPANALTILLDFDKLLA